VPVQLNSQDHYERLGIEKTATHDEVRRAYRALLRQYPPERAPEEFKRIREAYEILNDPASREEYDRAPSLEVQGYMRQAQQAMEAEDYAAAERYIKQIIIAEPELDFARNWLGLCYLYQKNAEAAVATFERLLLKPQPSSCWIGNAGHACRLAGRTGEAEQLFRRAIQVGDAAGDDVSSYYLGLAELYIEKRDFAAAGRTLEQAIGHDGVVDFADLPYFTKLVELRLHQDDLPGLTSVLGRLKAVCTGKDEREYAAWKLAVLGCDLVGMGAFAAATLVASAAKGLQPDQGDYQALAEAAGQLHARKPYVVMHLLEQHRSFGAGGWLARLAPRIRQHCDQMRSPGMQPITGAPSLFTLNGFGTMLYGERDYDPPTRSHVSVLYFVALFIPVFPIAAYRVIRVDGRRWSFLGKVPLSEGDRWHRRIAGGLGVVLVACMFLVGAFADPVPSYSTGGAESVASAYAPPSPSDWLTTEAAELGRIDSELRLQKGTIDWNESRIESLAPQIRMIRRAGGREQAASLAAERDRLVEENRGLIARYDLARADYRRRVEAYNRRAGLGPR